MGSGLNQDIGISKEANSYFEKLQSPVFFYIPATFDDTAVFISIFPGSFGKREFYFFRGGAGRITFC
jgi:hypothetical protein